MIFLPFPSLLLLDLVCICLQTLLPLSIPNILIQLQTFKADGLQPVQSGGGVFGVSESRVSTRTGERMFLDEMFSQVRSFEIFLLTDVAGIVGSVSLMNRLQVLLDRHLGPAGEVAIFLWANFLHFVVVNPHVGPDVCHGLPSVLAELTAEWFVRGVPVLDVRLQSGGGGAGHVAVRALVVVHVAPHVVAEMTLNGKLLVAGRALEGMSFLLLQTVVHELDPVGKQSPTVGAADQLLLAVASQMFPQFGDGGVLLVAAQPAALEEAVSQLVLGVRLDVPVEALSHLPVLLGLLAVRPLAPQLPRQVRQDVPLGGVELAGQQLVHLQHVLAVTLDLSVEGVEVDVPHHLLGVAGLEATLLPQTPEGVTERRRVVSDLCLLDMAGYVSHEVLHPGLLLSAAAPLTLKIQKLITK